MVHSELNNKKAHQTKLYNSVDYLIIKKIKIMKFYHILAILLLLSSCTKRIDFPFINFTLNQNRYSYIHDVKYNFYIHFASDDITELTGKKDENSNSDYIYMRQPSNWGSNGPVYITILQNGNYYKSFGYNKNGNYVTTDVVMKDRDDEGNGSNRIGTFSATMYPVSFTTQLAADTIIGAPIILSEGVFRAKQ